MFGEVERVRGFDFVRSMSSFYLVLVVEVL